VYCLLLFAGRLAKATHHAALIFPPLHSLRCFERFALSTFFVYMSRARWRAFSSRRAQAVHLLCSSTRCPMMRPQARAREVAVLSSRSWFWPVSGSACWGVCSYQAGF
jgi:hypothetical protein